MRIAFGPWLPDQPDIGHAGLEEAANCLPYAQGYGPLPDVVPFGTSVTASAITGGYATRDLSAAGYSFAGTREQLYRMSATGAWENVGRTASYATLSTTNWRFATFGNTVLACNGIDAMQVYTLGSSSRFADQSASASAPVATYLAVVRDFVFAGRISDFSNRVQWSQINNPLRWARSAQSQSDLQDLPGDGGNVVGIAGGDFATILTDRSVWRASFIGAPLTFRFDELAPNTGCLAPGSIARYQNLTFFLSGAGFMMFDGQQAGSIGDEQVDDWFFATADSGYFHRLSAVIDPDRKLYVVSFASTNAVAGTPDKLLIYNFESRRWTNADQVLEVLFSGIARGGYSLEQLDQFGTLDQLAYSLDSEQWAASRGNVLAGFNVGHTLVTFNAASARTARLITAEAQLIPTRRAMLREVRPLVQGSGATVIAVQAGQRDRLVDPLLWTASATMNAHGLCPLRANARFHRLRMDIAGGFERAVGLEVAFIDEGKR